MSTYDRIYCSQCGQDKISSSSSRNSYISNVALPPSGFNGLPSQFSIFICSYYDFYFLIHFLMLSAAAQPGVQSSHKPAQPAMKNDQASAYGACSQQTKTTIELRPCLLPPKLKRNKFPSQILNLERFTAHVHK